MGFNPREGTIDTHSLVTALTIGHCFVQLDALKLLLSNLKQLRVSRAEPDVDRFETSAPTSPKPPIPAVLTPSTARLPPSLGGLPPMSALFLPDAHSPVLHTPPASPLLQVLSVCHTIAIL